MIHAGNGSGNLVARNRMCGNKFGRAIFPRLFRGKAFPVNYLNLARYSKMVHFSGGKRFGECCLHRLLLRFG
jgi:hypothetical protein